ncbi:MAG: nucleotidyltransferase family protein, partial [Elusimicrobia bacterium]|nr:nucleotidyltransferase family protein [Elusimicrobiota bacterium]
MLPVIVAGGLGTRMGGEALPKALLAVAGKPLIDHQLRWLKNAGFSTVALCLGHKAEAIRSYCGAGKRWGLDLRYCVETQPRGTAGCVKDLRLDQDALVVYGDLYPDLELAPLLRGHGDHPEAGATLALLRTDHPRDSDRARLEGWRVCAIYRDPEGLRGGDL